MSTKEQDQDKPKSVNESFDQTMSDEDILKKAKINETALSKYQVEQLISFILDFSELLSDFKYYPYERPFARRIVTSVVTGEGATISGEFARQSGKSSTCATIVAAMAIILPVLGEKFHQYGIKSHFTNFRKGFWCGIYAPDYSRASIIGGKINAIFHSERAQEMLYSEFEMIFPKKITNYISRLPKNSFINVRSANKRVSLEGDTYHLIITDETQEMDDYVIKKSIRPMLASTNGTAVHIGSSYHRKVYFYDIIRLNKERDVHVSDKRRTNFTVLYTEVVKYNKMYKKYIENEKIVLGETSEEFRMSYELYWPLEAGMFISEEHLRLHLGVDQYVTNFDKKNDHVIGIDIAKDYDSTVVTILEVDWEHPVLIDPDTQMYRHYKKVKNWFEISGDDYDSQFIQICEFIDNYKWSTLVCDATGVGAHMFDRLSNRYKPRGKNCIPFIFTLPDKSYGYTLLKRELFSMDEKKRVPPRLTFPDSEGARKLKKHQNFMLQLTGLAKRWIGSYMTVEHASAKGHDDYPDSLMLAVYGVEEGNQFMSEIEEYQSDIFTRDRQRSFAREKSFWNKN